MGVEPMHVSRRVSTAGLLTFTLSKVPIYGTVRVILTPNHYTTNRCDGIIEFNYTELDCPSLHHIWDIMP